MRTDVHGTKTDGNAIAIVADDSGNLSTTQGTLGAGERNIDSATNSYMVTRNECNVTICDGTGAVDIGGGATGDVHLLGITILLNGAAATATIAGFIKDSGSATASGSIVLTGSTTADLHFPFYGAINSAAALTVTGSVDEKVIVYWRPV